MAVDRLVVTADKQGERDAQSSPSAISVLTGAELAQTAATSVEDTAGLAPGVTVLPEHRLRPAHDPRHRDQRRSSPAPTRARRVYLDGVYLARPAMVLGDFLDLERVEVLRGPQGTLYGRNAVGGALNVITQPPSESLSATERVGVPATCGARRGRGASERPARAGRLSGARPLARGSRTGSSATSTIPTTRSGACDVTAARGKLRLALGAQGELLLSGDVTHQDPTPHVRRRCWPSSLGSSVDNPQGLREVRPSIAAGEPEPPVRRQRSLAVRLASAGCCSPA